MEEPKQPKVIITDCTKDAEKHIIYNFMVMLERKMPKNPQSIRLGKKNIKEYLENIYNQAHHGVLEFVHFNFRIENCSRALQQQLTRTRTASYCIESLRIVEPRNFFQKGEYVMPDSVKNKIRYKEYMVAIERFYNNLVISGEKPEDARNLLPLGIHSTIHMSINLRNLITFLSNRLCKESQGEIMQLSREIVKEVRKKMPMIADIFFKSKCDKSRICNSVVPCGKYPTPKEHNAIIIKKNKDGEIKTSWAKK